MAGARRRRRNRVAGAGALAVVVVGLGAFGAAGLRGAVESDVGTPRQEVVSVSPQSLERPAFGHFRLGMTDAEARATGVLRLPGQGTGCVAYAVNGQPGDGVLVSPTEGVVGITLPQAGATPSGVGEGTTVDAARAAYPSLVVDGGKAVVPMGGWRYTFLLDGQAVAAVRIEKEGTACAGS
ncbi:putative secreted protein [Saccharothrix espanaensis DSM 44229]|uniref:Putative secreted protein n=1 Tax=Saccharothrix espanaensis (strain ATCC 51144 / DSM 44229 / JCM 9112 / NBRC 15066 / NRRL 15764) TaxID=1179773 RepID=K3W451_SACES|nr:putative secreted protein [Saccharothrix espanaensis DSM 44229]